MKNGKETVSVIIPTINRKMDILECVDSILSSSCRNIEIVVVDNASNDGTFSEIKKKYSNNKKIKIIKSEKNLGAAGGRNLGAKSASGDYFLFLDSDNIIDSQMIALLADFLKNKEDCVMAGPLMMFKSHPDRIWLVKANISLWTAKASYEDYKAKNIGQYPEVMEIGHLPNCMMIRRSDFLAVGGFDERYHIMYEEADLAERLKIKFGKKVFLLLAAVTYHGISYEDGEASTCGMRSSERAYLIARNRVYFMRKNAGFLRMVAFTAIFNPLILLYYQFKFIRNKRFDLAGNYLKGTWRGFFM